MTREQINFKIENNWKSFEEENPSGNTPCWLKLSNGRIVLAAYANNGFGATGWWQVALIDGQLNISRNSGYLAKDSVWQPLNKEV